MKVYQLYGNQLVFEGTKADCKRYIMEGAFEMSDGHCIFRRWKTEDGKYCYDTDNVYYTFEDIL